MTIKGRGPGKMPLRAHPARGPLVATPSVQDLGRKKREKSKGKKGKKEKKLHCAQKWVGRDEKVS